MLGSEIMKLWMIWPALALLWALQAGAALVAHREKPALIMLGMALFFALIGHIVRRNTLRSR